MESRTHGAHQSWAPRKDNAQTLSQNFLRKSFFTYGQYFISAGEFFLFRELGRNSLKPGHRHFLHLNVLSENTWWNSLIGSGKSVESVTDKEILERQKLLRWNWETCLSFSSENSDISLGTLWLRIVPENTSTNKATNLGKSFELFLYQQQQWCDSQLQFFNVF